MTDEERTIEQHARRYCTERGVTFLSCEYYPHITERPLWITIEDEHGGRYEIKKSYP